MFSADFAYDKLVSWINGNEKCIIALISEDDTPIKLLENTFRFKVVNTDPYTIFINNASIRFYKFTKDEPWEIHHQLLGKEFNYAWGHNVHRHVKTAAQLATRLGNFPIALFTYD